MKPKRRQEESGPCTEAGQNAWPSRPVSHFRGRGVAGRQDSSLQMDMGVKAFSVKSGEPPAKPSGLTRCGSRESVSPQASWTVLGPGFLTPATPDAAIPNLIST